MTSAPTRPAAAWSEAGAWESEGGALEPVADQLLPDGITAEVSMRYRVGSYIYTRREDALAEHRRQTTE